MTDKDELLSELTNLVDTYLITTGVTQSKRETRGSQSDRIDEIISSFIPNPDSKKIVEKSIKHFDNEFGRLKATLVAGGKISQSGKNRLKTSASDLKEILLNHAEVKK